MGGREKLGEMGQRGIEVCMRGRLWVCLGKVNLVLRCAQLWGGTSGELLSIIQHGEFLSGESRMYKALGRGSWAIADYNRTPGGLCGDAASCAVEQLRNSPV